MLAMKAGEVRGFLDVVKLGKPELVNAANKRRQRTATKCEGQ